MLDTIVIHRYADLAGASAPIGAQQLAHGLDQIFFESSNTKIFASAEARAQFRERWLGRYLTHDPQWAYIALTPQGQVAGYLAGCLSDPAQTDRFSDIAYFQRFAQLTAQFPAHLHINVAADKRGSGLGSALIGRFCRDAAKAGSCGVHVVTGSHARNVSFYLSNGFAVAASDGEGAKEVVFLARLLGRARP